jgi:single-strand DNA-binding protein
MIILNRIVLIGRLTRDPELRYTGNGTPVCNFRIACERNYSNRDGERDVDFINIVTWRGLAESCARHLGKGRLVGVEGQLHIRKSEKDGRKYINPEVNADNVRFLDYANEGSKGNNTQANNTSVQNEQKQAADEEFEKQFDDNFDADDFDVPF